MVFETSSAFISTRMSSLGTRLKVKIAVFSFSNTIARILKSFLHLTKASRVGSLIFLQRDSNFHNLGYASYSNAIARILKWLLHLTKASRVGSLIFSAKE